MGAGFAAPGRHDHAHDLAPAQRRRALGAAFWLTCAVLGVEAAGAWASGSLALAADAGHVLSDVLALGLAAWAARLAQRPATGAKTYGFGRTGVLVALFNALLLLLVTVGIAAAAAGRLAHPSPLRPGWMLAPAAVAVSINLFLARRLHGHAHGDLNVRSAWLHIAGDAGAGAAVIVAALLIAWTGRHWIDPALSLGIAALIAAGAWRIAREAVNVLLEGCPAGVDAARVAQAMAEVPGVCGVHHVHVWTVGGGQGALSGHLVLGGISLTDGQAISRAVERAVRTRFGITHCTLQIEAAADCADCAPR